MSSEELPRQTDIDDAVTPPVVERATAQLDALRVREKAHTREGDAIAAARRRLPMVEVDSSTVLIGPHGPLTLLDAFEGRWQLIAYYFMWSNGQPAPEQCEGCTLFTTQIGELPYLHARDITYATLCQGPYEESVRYRDFMGWTMPWYSAQGSLEGLLTGRRIGMFHLVCYLRVGDRVFETYWTNGSGSVLTHYWTNGRGVESMDNLLALLDLTVYGRQRRGRTRPPAGHSRVEPIATTGERMDAPPPNGPASKPGALTTSEPPGRDRRVVSRRELDRAESGAPERRDHTVWLTPTSGRRPESDAVRFHPCTEHRRSNQCRCGGGRRLRIGSRPDTSRGAATPHRAPDQQISPHARREKMERKSSQLRLLPMRRFFFAGLL